MLARPQCHIRQCKHFVGVKNDGDEATERVVCKAFSDRIPQEIAYGHNEHRKPFPGDNGIQYERAE